ncbi:MAG: hypothetical protein JWN93_102 [Hyphomicrobiales bacterium]|nr:hypothetical protein [Hyphomicrobiales bacterium]
MMTRGAGRPAADLPALAASETRPNPDSSSPAWKQYIPRGAADGPARAADAPAAQAQSPKLDEPALGYHDIARYIGLASESINELLRRNETLRKHSDETIASLQTDLETETLRVANLRDELHQTIADKERVVAESQRRIRELEELAGSLSAKLEQSTRDLELSGQWLSYLTGQLSGQLAEAVKQADVVLSAKSA